MKISVFQITTNTRQAQESLKWLKEQTIIDDIEIFQIENSKNQYSSAAKAYNTFAPQAIGDVFVFMHQDVYLHKKDTLEQYYNYLIEHKNAIAGAAGVSSEDRKVYGDVLETSEKIRRCVSCDGKIIDIIALDECLFAMSRELYMNIRFDEVATDNWHYYAVDMCYENSLRGGINVVLPCEIWHESKGNVKSDSFNLSTKKMIKKYKGKIKKLETTCIRTKCSSMGYYIYRLKMFVHLVLDKIKK